METGKIEVWYSEREKTVSIPRMDEPSYPMIDLAMLVRGLLHGSQM